MAKRIDLPGGKSVAVDQGTDWGAIKDWMQDFMAAPKTRWVVPGLVGGALLGGATGLSRRHGWGSMLGRGLLGAGLGAGLGWGIPKLINLFRNRGAGDEKEAAVARWALSEAVKSAQESERPYYLGTISRGKRRTSPRQTARWGEFQEGFGRPGGIPPEFTRPGWRRTLMTNLMLGPGLSWTPTLAEMLGR